jgi:hypothetical protein
MTDENKEHRDASPEPSAQPADDDEVEEIEVGRGANRRRFLIKTGAIVPPVVITLGGARQANASALTPSMIDPQKYATAAAAAKPAAKPLLPKPLR